MTADSERLQKRREINRRYREKQKSIVKPDRTGQKQVCYMCKQEKDYSEFSRSKYIPSGYKRDCKECYQKFRREQYHRLCWGISLAELEEMKKKQNYKCAICQCQSVLVIDHNHKTGLIRELLCDRCNRMLGFIDEKEETALRAVEYLRKHRNTNDPNTPGKRCLQPDKTSHL